MVASPGRELALLLLADGRFPSGGHAHSSGVEAAVGDGRVHDLGSLGAFVRGRLATTGVTDACLAVRAHALLAAERDGARMIEAIVECDREADVRQPSPPLRAASRRLGRQLLRAAGRCWPSPTFAALAGRGDGVHQAVAFAIVGLAADLRGEDVARLVVHHAVTTPAQAGIRLLGLDPYAVAALVAGLAADGELAVAEANAHVSTPLADLPARASLLVDVAALTHAEDDQRLFAS
jgi:urease accessory protein